MADSKFWGKAATVYDSLYSFFPYQKLLLDICRELKIKKGDLILDAGCGTGNLSLMMKNKGAAVIGIDNSSEMLEILKNKDAGIKTILTDLTGKLPFPENYFDKIVSNNVMYTISENNQVPVFREFYRVLKPNGLVLLVDPNKGWKVINYIKNAIKENKKQKFWFMFSNALKAIVPLAKMGYYNYLIKNKRHYFYSTPEHKIELLKQAGFLKIIKSKLVYSGQNQLILAQK